MIRGVIETRKRFIAAWVLYNTFESAMASSSQKSELKHAVSWAEEMDGADDLLEATGTALVPFSQLLEQVDGLESKKNKEEIDENKTPTAADNGKAQDELAALLDDEEKKRASVKLQDTIPIQKKLPKYELRRNSQPAVVPEKPLIDTESVEEEPEYEESFASQRETAELRGEFESICERFAKMEEQFKLVVAEREKLPSVINDIRQDINGQLTLFSSKLYAALEKNNEASGVASVLADINDIKTDQDGQLRAAAQYLAAPPSSSSPLVKPGVTLKGKGRFKAVK
jgi:hypothetical protein